MCDIYNCVYTMLYCILVIFLFYYILLLILMPSCFSMYLDYIQALPLTQKTRFCAFMLLYLTSYILYSVWILALSLCVSSKQNCTAFFHLSATASLHCRKTSRDIMYSLTEVIKVQIGIHMNAVGLNMSVDGN